MRLPIVSPTRKGFLIGGFVTLLVSTCVIFPIQYGKASFIDEFGYTYLTLSVSLFLLLFGFLGNNFFKGILFLIISSLIGTVLFYVAFPPAPFAFFVAFWLGVPSGIVAALLFMIINFCILQDIKKYKLSKQIVVYSIILLVVSILFGYGGDWFYELTK